MSESPDECTNPVEPHIVINDADTLRPNDLTQMGNTWQRIIAAKPIPAPEGTRIVDAAEVFYVDELQTNIVDQFLLTADGRKVRKSMLPGDKPCRIIRRIDVGDTVAPLTVAVDAANAVDWGVTPPDVPLATVVRVDDDGRSIVIETPEDEDGVASIGRNHLYAVTEGTRPQ